MSQGPQCQNSPARTRKMLVGGDGELLAATNLFCKECEETHLPRRLVLIMAEIAPNFDKARQATIISGELVVNRATKSPEPILASRKMAASLSTSANLSGIAHAGIKSASSNCTPGG